MKTKLVCKSCGDDLSMKRRNNLVRSPGRNDTIFCDSDCYMDYEDNKVRNVGTTPWDSEEEYQRLVALNADDKFAFD